MKRAGILTCVLALVACEVAAQPLELCVPEGLMQGFPPPPEKQVTTTSGHRHWLRYPNTAWSFRHTRELFPTRAVARGATVAELPEDPKDLNNLEFEDAAGNKKNFVLNFATDKHTDATIVLHKGNIVYEYYRPNCMNRDTHHLLFSASKSFVGLVAAIMACPPSQGEIDENKQVSEYVPELAVSAYGDATIRQVMDMTAGVKFTEDYKRDPTSDMYRYLAAAGWIPNPLFQGPSNLYEALCDLKDYEAKHGRLFVGFGKGTTYKSPNADVLAWVVSKASGKSLSQLVSELIWSKIGAEQDAYYLLDPAGKEAAFGGLNVTLRDFARFGQMMLENGDLPRKGAVSSDAINDIKTKGGTPLSSWTYRSQWWKIPNGAIMAYGVHGQGLYIDSNAKIVVAKFGSYREPDPPVKSDYQNVVAALATYLQNK